MNSVSTGLRKQRRLAVREAMNRRFVDYPELAAQTGFAVGTLKNCVSGSDKNIPVRRAIERVLKIAVWP